MVGKASAFSTICFVRLTTSSSKVREIDYVELKVRVIREIDYVELKVRGRENSMKRFERFVRFVRFVGEKNSVERFVVEKKFARKTIRKSVLTLHLLS